MRSPQNRSHVVLMRHHTIGKVISDQPQAVTAMQFQRPILLSKLPVSKIPAAAVPRAKYLKSKAAGREQRFEQGGTSLQHILCTTCHKCAPILTTLSSIRCTDIQRAQLLPPQGMQTGQNTFPRSEERRVGKRC